MTIAEIESQFESEWVLVEDPQTNNRLEVLGGKVRHHSKDRDEVYRKAVALRPEFYGSVVLLGATLYMLGDDDAALPVLERAHRLNPADAQTAAVLEKLRVGRKKE